MGSETLGQSVGATFADQNVDTGIVVTVNSITLSDGDNGGLADNYTISTGQTTTADITAKALTITADDKSKTYGEANPALTFSVAEDIDGLAAVSGSVATTATATTNVSSVAITQGTVTNANNSNYDITFINGALTIGTKTLTATASASNKVYDGNTTASVTLTFSGLVGDETLNQSVGATFADKDVANAKTVTVNSITLSDDGGLASNYTISTGQITTANITQLSSVTWNGNAGDGLWSSASNWAGSAIPDQNNVAAVVIPSDESVTFDSDTVGTIGSTITNNGTLTFNGATDYTFGQVISGSGALVKSNTNILTLNATNTYSGNTTISAGTIKLTGSVNALTDLTIASGATLDLQSTQTFATLDLDGTISNSAGSSELTITGASDIGGDITTSGSQTYTGAVTISNNITLTTTDSNITFSSTVDSDGTARDLTIDMDNGEGADGTVQFINTVGANDDLDVIDITGNLNLDAAISNTTSLEVSGTSNLGADVTTSSTQTYTGDVTISADISLNTSGGDVTFDGDVNTNTTSSSESGILQFLGGGSYKYSTDGGSTYSTGTATSSATTLGTGSLTFSSGSYTWTTPDGASATKLLVVGGGGGGGSSRSGNTAGGAGGGGAGGLIYNANYSISANTSYTVTVGSGGVGGDSNGGNGENGTEGGNSVFNDQTAVSGGYGGIGNDSVSNGNGGSGGSGGGGGNDGNGSTTGRGGSGTSGQGYAGGSVTGSSGDLGAGGGGAGGAGADVNATSGAMSGGAGGVGVAYDITGTSTYYAGGGGGATNHSYPTYTGGAGGLGGGGAGGNNDSDGSDGTANTGGGGGGGADSGGLGGNGGSGIVVVNYSYTAEINEEHNLTINSGSGATDINGAVANIGTLSITSTSTSSEVSGIISTDTNLTKAGSGTLTLSGTNTYSGSTTITNGVISISSSANLGATPVSADADNIIFNGGTLTTTSTFTLGTTKGITMTGTGTINTNTGTLSYGGVTAGSGNLTKSGSGTLILSGANGHTGDLNITAGTATITGTLHNSTDVTVSSGAVYDVDQTDTINSLSGAGDIEIASSKTLTTGDSGSDTISGVISGAGNLTKAGSGTLTLSGTNTYSGSTTITNGVISISSSANLGATPVSADADNIIFNGGTLTTTSTFTLGTTKGITMTGTGTINTNTGTLSYGGVTAGSGNLTKSGSGTLILSGANGHTGDLNITAGTATITGTLHNSTDVTVSSGAVYDVDQTDTINSLSGAGDIEIASSKTLTTGDSGSDTISGVISGAGNLTKAGSGTLTLSGTNTYSGSTTITNGVISISSSANLGATPVSADADNIIFNGGTLTTTSTFTLGTTKGITMTGTGTINTNTGTLSYGGVTAGSGNLTKSGSGTLILSGANGHTGDLNITAGTATITGTLHNSTDVTVSSGAVYDVDQTDTINSLSGAGDIEIASSKTLTTGDSGSDTISGVISGAGNLTKAGSGTLTLSGTNTYSGSTTITNGVISISSSANLGATPVSADADNIIFNGGTLTTTSTFTLGTTKGITMTGTGTINTSTGTALGYGGIIDGSGTLTKDGSGSITLTGVSTFDGNLNIDAGTVVLDTGQIYATGTWGSHGIVTINSGGSLHLHQFTGEGRNLGNLSYHANLLVIDGGTLQFIGDSDLDGTMGDAASNGADNKLAFTIGENGGTLANNTDYTWSIWQDTDTATYNPVYNGDLTIHGSGDFSFNAVVSGSINLTKTGSGTLLLSANNTYTGQTNINAGIISITDNNSLGSADGATIVADGASLSISNNITSAENITISGTGISSNGAIRNTADDNTLTGLITLAADSEIQIDSGSSLTLNPTTGSAVTGTYNLTIESVGTSSINDPIAISTGNIIKTGAGTLTLSGTNTFTGDLTISAGTVTVSGTLHDDVDVINSGTYDVDTTDTINSLSGSGAVELNTGITLTTGDEGSDEISGIISGAGNLTKVGAGTLTLSTNNTFTGDLTISAGTVTVSGTLHDDVDVINSGTYNVNTTDTINSLSGSGRVALGFNQTLTTGDAGNYEISGVISATGSLTKVGSGTLTLSNTNTFTGDLTISAGTVTVSGTLHDDVDVINSGTYDVDTTDTINSLSGSGAVELNTGITLTTGDEGSDEISGIISGAGNLTKVGSGTLTLSNTNTYSGITIINNGTISISADNGLGAAPGSVVANQLTINGGTLNTSSTFSLATNRGITIGANDATIDVDGSTTLSYAGAITGSGDLTKTGDGTLNLTGSTDFSGSTTIGAGGLGLSDVLPSGTDLTVTGTLNLLASFTVNTLSGSGNVNLSSYNLTISNGSSSDDTTFSGVIDSTTGRLIKDGDGTQTLSGTNTYSGTTINGGILKVSADANLGTAPGSTDADNIILGGGTLNTTASFTLNTNRGITLTGNSSVNVNSSTTLTYAGVIADNASTYNITKSGSGSLALSGTHTYDGDTTISAGTIVLTGALNTATDMIISSGAIWDLQTSQTINSLNLDGTISNGAGSSSLTVSNSSDIGGSITTSGTQTYTGAVVISAAVTLTTTDSDVLFSSTINGTATNESLTISTGSGDVTFSSTIGASTAINRLSVTSSGTIYVAGNITTADAGTAGLYAEYFNEDNFAGNPSSFNSWSADTPLSSMVSFNDPDNDETVTHISNSTMTTAFICRGGSCGDSYSWRVSGYFNPSSDGTYYFATASDDYSLVYIGDAGESISSFITNVQSYSSYNNSNISNDLIVNNGGDHPVVTRTGFKTGLTAGNSYPIIMYFDENGGGDYFAFAYNTTGIASIDSNSEVQSNVANLTSEFTHNEGGSAGDGTITFNGAVTLTGSSTMTGDTQFASTLTGGSNGLTVTGDLDLDGAASGLTSVSVSGTSDLDANITTSGSQTYTGAATLNADVILTTTDNNISFGSTINSLDTTYRDLSLVTGSGNVSVTGIIGADDKLDVLTVNNTGTLTLSAATTVNTLTLTHTGGTTIGGTLTATTINLTDTTDAANITFNGNVSATTLNTAAEGYNVIFNGTTSTITNLVTFSNSGSVTFGNGTGDTTTFTGGVTATAPSQVNLAGTIQTTNTLMSLGDAGTPIVLTANTILSGNTAGAITLGGTVNGGYSLTVNTTGNTTFTRAVGNTTALTTLTTNASGTTYINGGAITTSSTQTYGDAVVLGADTTLTTTDSDITFSSTVDSDSGDSKRDLTLTLGNGSASVTGIVGTTSLDVLTLNSSVTFNAAVTATNLTIAANKTATVKDDVTIASTIALSGTSTLASDQYFCNDDCRYHYRYRNR